jgi:hypothetical protein
MHLARGGMHRGGGGGMHVHPVHPPCVRHWEATSHPLSARSHPVMLKDDSDVQATLLVVRGRPRPMDLVCVETTAGPLYSCLREGTGCIVQNLVL